MAATKLSVSPKPTKQELAAAKSFVKLLLLTSKDPEYNFAISWYIKESRKHKTRQDVLTKKQRETFDADVAAGRFGNVHNAILNRIINELNQYKPPKKQSNPRQSSKNKKLEEPTDKELDKILEEIRKGDTPTEATEKVIKPTPKKAEKKETNKKPTITLETSNPIVSKGEKFTLKWESTDADTVIASDFNAKSTSGIVEIQSISKTTTYEIIVSGSGGTAEASVTVFSEEEFDAAIKEARATSSEPETKEEIPEARKKIEDKLPNHLYRESISRGNFDLFFEMDFDMACYVLATKPGRKNPNNPYLLWARQVSGQDIKVIYEHGKKVAKIAVKRIKDSVPRK